MKDTLFLRFLAIVLITNSHLDALYPIPALASGGSLGNSLFFMLSGLGLALSGSTNRFDGFLPWFKYRLERIYPLIWLVVFVVPFLLLGGWKTWGWMEYLYSFLYPTTYWFISALVVFYMLIYPIIRYKREHWVPWLILGLALLYFVFYCTILDLSRFSIEDKGFFKWIFYFQIMLFGIWLVPRYRHWREHGLTTFKRELLLLLIVCLVYVGLKVGISKGYGTVFQFLVQWITFPFVYLCLRLSQHPIVEKLFRVPLIGPLIAIMGMCTLEIYLLQHHIYHLPLVLCLSFPWNVLLFWCLTTSLADGLHHLIAWLPKRKKTSS